MRAIEELNGGSLRGLLDDSLHTIIPKGRAASRVRHEPVNGGFSSLKHVRKYRFGAVGVVHLCIKNRRFGTATATKAYTEGLRTFKLVLQDQTQMPCSIVVWQVL